MAIQNQNLPDNPQIEVIKSGKTGLFTNYIYKAIPLAFDESMSYYETLCGLLNYLKNVVIPTVNNNADAVAELQALYEQLKSYVDNYFTNLDVQEEINNKLDQMVTDGTLPEIVASYLNSKAIFGFDNVESMKSATNLIDGSYAQTLGYHTKNDGGSSLYKIRTITTNDIVNEMTIIALNDNSLIAELVKSNWMNVKQFGAKGDGETNDTNSINTALSYNNNIIIPNGTYMIKPNTSDIMNSETPNGGILLNNNNYIINYGTLQCITNNYDSYHVVLALEVSNVTFEGGKIYGDKLTHTGSTSSEFGHCLDICSSHKITIKNCEIAYGFGDSINLNGRNYGKDPATNNTDVVIENCILHDSRRQGISVISAERTTIKNCYIHHISGIAPQSGIDIESNYPDENPVKICYIDNCKFNNNTKADIIVTAKAEDVNINNCDINSDLIVNSSGNNVKISNCNINHGLLCGADIETLVDHCVFKNTPIQNTILNSKFIVTNSLFNTNYLTYPTTDGDTYATFKNCTFNYDVGNATSSQPEYYLFYTRQNTNLIVDSCKITSNGGISASPAKSVYAINNDITCATDTNGFNTVKATLLNNTINNKFWRFCSLNTSSNNNFIINNYFALFY